MTRLSLTTAASPGRATRALRTIAMILTIAVVAPLLAPLLAPYDPLALGADSTEHGLAPSFAHWLGTDPLGRDIASRLLVGARYTIGVASSALTIALAVGILVGTLSAMIGGAVDRAIMRAVDICLAVPRVVLLLAVMGLWGAPSVGAVLIVLGTTGWFDLSRLVRATLRGQLAEEHVLAARALGVGRWRLAVGHLLPATVGPVAVWATTQFGQLMLLETGLSFLGLGIPAPAPSWGRVLLETGDVFGPSRWLVLGPGLLIAATVGAVYGVGDALADAVGAPSAPVTK